MAWTDAMPLTTIDVALNMNGATLSRAILNRLPDVLRPVSIVVDDPMPVYKAEVLHAMPVIHANDGRIIINGAAMPIERASFTYEPNTTTFAADDFVPDDPGLSLESVLVAREYIVNELARLEQYAYLMPPKPPIPDASVGLGVRVYDFDD